MKDQRRDRPSGSATPPVAGGVRTLPASSSTIAGLYAQAHASRWGLSHEQFACALERSAQKVAGLPVDQVEGYLGGLRLEDLALATACLEGCEAAWEHFIASYRAYLRSAASAVLRCSSAAAEASDLADSLFAELYGLADGSRREHSLFRYFHGRSSLKTWLRAVLAQRHIDALRANRRFESLDDEESPAAVRVAHSASAPPPSDPHRPRYVALFVRALDSAVAQLDSRDQQRLRSYYADEHTLAEIGRQLGEHESSVSRNLDRIRLALRHAVEQALRQGCPAANGFAAEPGLSDAEISLCFEYASADSSFDLQKLLRPRPPGAPAGRPNP
jgi:RNA polymerase sigma factor (sigma-70 family)